VAAIPAGTSPGTYRKSQRKRSPFGLESYFQAHPRPASACVSRFPAIQPASAQSATASSPRR